jgi:hypothetical protein
MRAADSPQELTTKAVVVLVAIVLIGIPFARLTKDWLEPTPHHRHHVIAVRG